MNAKYMIKLASVAALVMGCNVYAASAVTEKAAILQTLSSYESALNHSDAEKIVSLYTDNGVQMPPDAPAFVGRAALKSAYEHTFAAISLNLKFSPDEIELVGDNTAILRSHSDGTLQLNNSNQQAGAASFKELFVLKKQSTGAWLFSHYSFNTVPVAK